MRVVTKTAIGLVCFLELVFSEPVSSTLVSQDGYPWPWPRRPRTTTIVDLLSSNAEFGPLIKALQRTALIPILNASDNVTLLAPIADAIDEYEGELKQELMMYHILNGSVLSDMVDDEVVVESILKMDPKDNTSLGIGVKIERQGDRGRGQGKLRVGGCARVVKSDWEANNGMSPMTKLTTGVVQVVDKLMDIPKTIHSLVAELANATTFHSLYKGETFPTTYSLFVPEDSSFDILHPVELSYLKTRYGHHDRTSLLMRHACNPVLYRKDLRKGGNVSSLEGEKIHYVWDTNDTLIDKANVTQADIVARNGSPQTSPNVGVIHMVSKLFVPASVIFSPLKYLYGLHDVIFAETLTASDSFSLANDSSIHQTIFAPVDEAYADVVTAAIAKPEVLKQVRYNFIQDPIDVEKIEDKDLLRTKYELKALGGAAQMVKVTKENGKIWLNNQVEVLSDSVHSGNTIIYNIASRLSPPGPLRPTSSEGMSLFRSFHHLISTQLDQRIIFDEVAITVFLPVDHAWKTLGLAEKYLLSEEADLQKVLLHCIFKGIHYSKDLPSKSSYKSLNGDRVTLHVDGKNLVFDGLGIHATMEEWDILASNGVAHSLSVVPIPASVVITPENLINATGSTTWREILQKYDLTKYLDLDSNHTLLIPTDEAINRFPFNSLKEKDIKSIIDFHIIPPTNGQAPADLLSDKPVPQHTLAGRAISARQIYKDVWSIQINDSANSARVLDQGKTSTGAQILLIDQVLFEPDTPHHTWIQPIAVIIFAVAMTVMIAAGVGYALRQWQKRKETKPLFEQYEEEPFLNGNST